MVIQNEENENLDTSVDNPQPDQATASQDEQNKKPKARSSWFNWIWTPIALAFLLCAGTLFGGFVRFAEDVTKFKAPQIIEQYDAIAVLTGGKNRITNSVSLLKQDTNKRLLISGVNPNISDTDLMKVTGANQKLFDCCIDVGRDAKDTIGNGKEIAIWAEDKAYKNILIVTSDYHMRRSLYELRANAPDINLIAYPIKNNGSGDEKWYKNTDLLRTLINEFAKLNLSYFRQFAGIKMAGNLYSERDRSKTANASGLGN
jgi:uncharacterized SAM-binding protein YcdF (DUF218 family)